MLELDRSMIGPTSPTTKYTLNSWYLDFTYAIFTTL